MRTEGSDSDDDKNSDAGNDARDLQRGENRADPESSRQFQASAQADSLRRRAGELGKNSKRLDESGDPLSLLETELTEETLWIGAVPSPE